MELKLMNAIKKIAEHKDDPSFLAGETPKDWEAIKETFHGDVDEVDPEQEPTHISDEAADLASYFPQWMLKNFSSLLEPDTIQAFKTLATETSPFEEGEQATIHDGLLSFALSFLSLPADAEVRIARWIIPLLHELKSQHSNASYLGEIIHAFDIVEKNEGNVPPQDKDTVEGGLLTMAQVFNRLWA